MRDLYSSRAKLGDAFTVNLRVGVGGGHYHAGDAGGYQCVRAGPGSSLVTAGFEGYVSGRTMGQRARLLDSDHFGVVAAIVLMKALAHDRRRPEPARIRRPG